jgi:hypothetical protein
MSHRNLCLAWLFALSAIAFGCRGESTNAGMGRLDLLIQPESSAAAVRQVRGTFTLRRLDSEAGPARRVSIAAEPYRTLSVSVASGLYSLGWEPERTLEDGVGEGAEPPELVLDRATLPALMVAPDQVTLLRIRSTSPAQRDPSTHVLASRDPA